MIGVSRSTSAAARGAAQEIQFTGKHYSEASGRPGAENGRGMNFFIVELGLTTRAHMYAYSYPYSCNKHNRCNTTTYICQKA